MTLLDILRFAGTFGAGTILSAGIIRLMWPRREQPSDFRRRRIANTPSKVRDISTARGWRGAR